MYLGMTVEDRSLSSIRMVGLRLKRNIGGKCRMLLDVYPQSSIEEENWMVLKLQRKCTLEEVESWSKGSELFQITYVEAAVLFYSRGKIWKKFDGFCIS
ncbi:hypothetical protein TNCT_587101 [Trichonephila clavata]|uniref:Uncharacterized protein n=1 Tax=Trichonephila clavata TaxID=2740835 RepID=A0A8X6HFE6_TRICU|nr:hypothetical protein TNCT_587101 [Trichonephila clavata]